MRIGDFEFDLRPKLKWYLENFGYKQMPEGSPLYALNPRAQKAFDDTRRRLQAEAKAEKEAKANRKCDDCGVDISHRNGNAVRCVDCQKIREKNKRQKKVRICQWDGCETDISHRGPSSKYCEQHADESFRNHTKVYNARRAAKKKLAEPQKERKCEDCGTDISQRNPRAVMCVDCAKKRSRKASARCKTKIRAKAQPKTKKKTQPNLCEDCGTDISHRANQAKRCEPCAEKHGRERQAEWRREDRAKERLAKPQRIRLCESCNKDISDRNRRATLCWDCKKEHKRANQWKYNHGRRKQKKQERLDDGTMSYGELGMVMKAEAPDGMKWCNRGRHYVSIDEYGTHKSMCKPCHASYQRDYVVKKKAEAAAAKSLQQQNKET